VYAAVPAARAAGARACLAVQAVLELAAV